VSGVVSKKDLDSELFRFLIFGPLGIKKK